MPHPNKGSWLHIAECELSTQCLKERAESIEKLNLSLTAWASDQNLKQRGVDWQFTADGARIRLKRLYPVPMINDEDLDMPEHCYVIIRK